ncbi:MAG: hypothetical protein Q9213_001226 [Squamulea squamosa]
MEQVRHRSCKDEPDRIFALRGLLPENSSFNIQPDYSKSIEQVYTDFAATHLKLGNIEVLYDAGLWKRTSSQLPDLRNEISDSAFCSEYLPTWVPDYRNQTDFVRLATIQFGTYFGLDPKVPLKVELLEKPYRLRAQAMLLDRFTFVQPASFSNDKSLRTNHVDLFFTCRQFYKGLEKTFDSYFCNSQYPTGENLATAFAYSLVGGGTDGAYTSCLSLSKPIGMRLDPLSMWHNYEKECICEDGEVYKEMRRMQKLSAAAQKRIGMTEYSRASAESTTA